MTKLINSIFSILITIHFLQFVVTLQAENRKLRIGLILPLSGDFSQIGRSIQNGFKSTITQTNQEKFEVFYEDDQTFNRMELVKAFNRLVYLYKVDIVITTGAPAIEPILPLVKKSKVILISLWDYKPRYQQIEQGIFSLGFSNERAGKDMSEFISSFDKIKTVAVVKAEDDWSETVSEAAVKALKEKGKLITSEDTVSLTESDFSSLIVRIKRQKADAVFFPIYKEAVINFIKQSKLLNYEGVLFTGEGLLPEDIKILGDFAKGVYYQKILPEKDVLTQRDKTNDNYIGFYSMGMDLSLTLTSALKKLDLSENSISFDGLKESIKAVKADGVLGPIDMSNLGEPNKKLKIVKCCGG